MDYNLIPGGKIANEMKAHANSIKNAIEIARAGGKTTIEIEPSLSIGGKAFQRPPRDKLMRRPPVQK